MNDTARMIESVGIQMVQLPSCFRFDVGEGPVIERPCDIMSGRLTEGGYAPMVELPKIDQTWEDFLADHAEFPDLMADRPLNTMIEEGCKYDEGHFDRANISF